MPKTPGGKLLILGGSQIEETINKFINELLQATDSLDLRMEQVGGNVYSTETLADEGLTKINRTYGRI